MAEMASTGKAEQIRKRPLGTNMALQKHVFAKCVCISGVKLPRWRAIAPQLSVPGFAESNRNEIAVVVVSHTSENGLAKKSRSAE